MYYYYYFYYNLGSALSHQRINICDAFFTLAVKNAPAASSR